MIDFNSGFSEKQLPDNQCRIREEFVFRDLVAK
jgi:hypothetical protein